MVFFSMILEVLALLVGAFLWIRGGETMAVFRVVAQNLLWGQIACGVVGLLFFAGAGFVFTLIGGLVGAFGGAAAAERLGGWGIAMGGGAGGLAGAGLMAGFSILGTIKYLLRKALFIGGCVLFLTGWPANTTMMVGGCVLYAVGWLWQRSVRTTVTQTTTTKGK